MTFQEAQEYLYRANVFGIRPGLERIRELMRRLGNPEEALRFVHIAGTNGKGSVSSFCAHIAAAEDLKTGWYTSPYLENFNERFRILDGRRGLDAMAHDFRSPELPDARFAELMTRLAAVISDMLKAGFEMPTVFEMETALAILWFYEEKCDLVVFEVGLGGRLDSTNVIQHSLVSVITALSYDHQDRLGTRLGQIAYEKAGILKPGCPVVLYDPRDAVSDPNEAGEALLEVRQRAESLGCPLTLVSRDDLAAAAEPDEAGLAWLSAHQIRQSFCFRHEMPSPVYATRLHGDYQLMNAAVAVKAARYFASEASIIEGLARTVWPGRLEHLQEQPLILLDGAHNIQGCEALAAELDHCLQGESVIFLTGMLADKDHRDMLRTVLRGRHYRPALVLTTDPPVPRALDAKTLAAEAAEILDQSPNSVQMQETAVPDWTLAWQALAAAQQGLPETTTTPYNQLVAYDRDYQRAVRRALQVQAETGLPLVLFGSLYLIGNARPIIRREV